MTFTGKTILERAGTILNDTDYVRWTLPELCGWLNEGLAAIVLAKPSAKSETRVLSLNEGTLQHLATVAEAPAPLALINLTRNLAATTPVRVGGRIIKPVSVTLLNAEEPDWHNPDVVPFAKEVRHLVFDELNPLNFYVYPGNDGTGVVEAVVSVMPDLLVPTGGTTALANYDLPVDLPEPYSVPLLDYVLYRAFAKDAPEGQLGKAAAYYQSFAAALGIKIQVEGASSPNARRA